MVQVVPNKLRPVSGFSYLFHWSLVGLLPLVIYALVRIEFFQLALLVVLLSKWRVLAVKPRFWWLNIRSNAVDLMVSLSLLTFMIQSANSVPWLLLWAVVYELWLVVIKPRAHVLMVGLQAFIGQAFALMALFLAWPDAPLIAMVVITGLICYLSARHFLASFEDSHSTLYAAVWAYFAAALSWILGHWLLFYATVAQPTVLLSVLALTLGALYNLDQTDRLSALLRRQFIFIMMAVVVVVLVFSDWSDKSI